MTASKIALSAKRELSAITGLEADTVSGVSHDQDEWYVTVEMVDLKRIPPSSDVLDTYEVVLDEDGGLLSYRRVARYCRGETTEMVEEKRHA